LVTVQIETPSPWDALALVKKLPRYHWYLVEPSAERWDVCVPLEDPPPGGLPADLRRMIELWLRERDLGAATIHAGAETYELARYGFDLPASKRD